MRYWDLVWKNLALLFSFFYIQLFQSSHSLLSCRLDQEVDLIL